MFLQNKKHTINEQIVLGPLVPLLPPPAPGHHIAYSKRKIQLFEMERQTWKIKPNRRILEKTGWDEKGESEKHSQRVKSIPSPVILPLCRFCWLSVISSRTIPPSLPPPLISGHAKRKKTLRRAPARPPPAPACPLLTSPLHIHT